MNRLLTPRLVGLVTLILLAVLVIPWILSGPPPERPDLVKRVAEAAAKARQPLLGAESGAPLAQGAVFAPSTPVFAVDGAPSVAPERLSEPGLGQPLDLPPPAAANPVEPAPVLLPRADQAAVVVTPRPVAASQWMVQVATLGSSVNVEHLRERLRRRGFKVSVQPLRQGARTVYRVRVGPYPDRVAARDAQATVNRLFRVKSLLRKSDS